MPEFTVNQWAILFLVLVLGWLLGLISRSGGKKWKRAYEAEREARAEEVAELEQSRARLAELEAAAAARPAVVATPAVVDGPATTVVAPAEVATPATLDLTHDDLSRIRGIGAAGQRRLNDEGIYRYSDITGLTPEEEAALEQKLGADDGYIEQEQWREQAALLAAGQTDQHRATYG